MRARGRSAIEDPARPRSAAEPAAHRRRLRGGGRGRGLARSTPGWCQRRAGAGRGGARGAGGDGDRQPHSFDRNGLKFYRPEGEIAKADEAGIAAARRGAGRAACGAPAGRVGRPMSGAPSTSSASVAYGLRVGVYEHSAAGRDLLVAALGRLGAEVVPFGASESSCRSTPRRSTRVRAADRRLGGDHRLDALVSTDGDGDRPLVADEAGAVLRGDAVGILAARALGADAVAAPINVSTALERSGWFVRTRAHPDRLALRNPGNGGAGDRGRAARGRVRGERRLPARGRGPSGPAARLAPLPTRDAMLPMLAVLAEAVRAGLPAVGTAGRACPSGRQRVVGSSRWRRRHRSRLLERLEGFGGRARRLRDAGRRRPRRRGRPDRRAADDAGLGRGRAPAAIGQRAGAGLLCRGGHRRVGRGAGGGAGVPGGEDARRTGMSRIGVAVCTYRRPGADRRRAHHPRRPLPGRGGEAPRPGDGALHPHRDDDAGREAGLCDRGQQASPSTPAGTRTCWPRS